MKKPTRNSGYIYYLDLLMMSCIAQYSGLVNADIVIGSCISIKHQHAIAINDNHNGIKYIITSELSLYSDTFLCK